MDEEGGLAGNTEDNEDPFIATGLNREYPTPEVNENDVNTSVMFLRGDIYARGKVIRRKRDADKNAVVRTNNNPILDRRKYCVEFDDGEVIEMTTNVIIESMYSACDEYGKEYLIMDLIMDYQKNDKDISVSNQKVVHRIRIFMRRYNVGWKLCVQWRYGLKSWQSLKYMRD